MLCRTSTDLADAPSASACDEIACSGSDRTPHEWVTRGETRNVVVIELHNSSDFRGGWRRFQPSRSFLGVARKASIVSMQRLFFAVVIIVATVADGRAPLEHVGAGVGIGGHLWGGPQWTSGNGTAPVCSTCLQCSQCVVHGCADVV